MAYAGSPQIMSAAAARGKNSNAIMADWVDRGPWMFWDTAFFANATALPTQINFFAIPLNGQNVVGSGGGVNLITGGLPKTKFMTNMRDTNKLVPPQCLLLKRIGVQFSSNFLKPDIDSFLNSYWLELKIDQKVFHEGWLADFPAGGGLSGVSENSGESVYVNGLPSVTFQRQFGDWAKYIAPEQFFSVTLFLGLTSGQTVPTLGSGSAAVNYAGNVRIVLDGLTDRSVQ
jgi:hypothetical protein